MFQYNGKALFSRVREEYKIAFMLLAFAAAFLLSSPPALFFLFIFLAAFLAIAGYRDFPKLFLGLLPFLAMADLGFIIFLSNSGLDLVALTLSSNLRILCLFTATAFFTFSTDPFSMLKLLQRMRLPESISLPIFVLFRFLPEMEKDTGEIIAFQKLKGITKRNPLLFLRSILLALLLVSLQKADELAIAYYLRKKREAGNKPAPA